MFRVLTIKWSLHRKRKIRYDMKNTKTEEEKKRLQKDWEAIDERQRYSPISTPGTYWDLKTGRPFTVKEGGSLFEPVLVTATRAHGENPYLKVQWQAESIQKLPNIWEEKQLLAIHLPYRGI